MTSDLSLKMVRLPMPTAMCGDRESQSSESPASSATSSCGNPPLARSSGVAELQKQDALERTMSAGQIELRRLRYRMAMTMLVLCFLIALVCEVGLQEDVNRAWRKVGDVDRCHYCNNPWQEHPFVMGLNLLYWTRFAALSLASLSDDLRMMRCILALDVSVVAFTNAMVILYYTQGRLEWQVSVWSLVYANTCSTIVFAGLAVWTACSRSATAMQRRMWMTLAVWMFLQLCLELVRDTSIQLRCHGFCPMWWTAVFQAMFLILFGNRDFLHSIQGLLNRIFLAKSTQRAAASIAGLVGDFSAKRAAGEATSRFRMVQLADLKFEDLENNKPNPALFGLSIPARLGACDAFVSHSWSDDAEAKWVALQKWRSSFLAERKREPYIWFDKCCIDQNNIDTDLRCLPVFLSGCRELVVLCGASYLSRLWCIVEIFTFVHMGGIIANLSCFPVLRGGQEQEDFERLDDGFENFDARRCTCYSSRDKEKMLGIIHAAYGDLTSFNRDVRCIFEAAGWVNAKHSDDSASSSSGPADSVV